MADREQPYDPYIPSEGAHGYAGASEEVNPKIAKIKSHLENTVNQIQENIDAATNRGEHLDSLQDKTDTLAASAQGFRKGANRVRKQMWWKDMKMRICIIVGIIILLIVIIVPSVVASKQT